MLPINHQPIKPSSAHNLGRQHVAKRQPGPKRGLSVFERSFERVERGGHGSLLCDLDAIGTKIRASCKADQAKHVRETLFQMQRTLCGVPVHDRLAGA